MAESRHISNLKDFDFVRFCWSDTHGISRGRLVPVRHVRRFISSGVGIFQGIFIMGTASQMMDDIPENFDIGVNVSALPEMETLHLVPWAGDCYRVGQVICALMVQRSLAPVPHCPRNMLKLQLEKLHARDLDIFSSFECEVTMRKKDEIDNSNHGFCAFTHFSKVEDWIMKIDAQMLEADIDIETYQAEYSQDQFEMVLKPRYGIETADQMFKFRNGMKELSSKCGYNVFFMAKPEEGLACNGCHYNHSICSLSHESNAFGNDGDRSSLCKQWLSGLLKHARGLTALCCPTVNCYRRLHTDFAPKKANWSIDDKSVAFRVKIGKGIGSYIENRIPSGACNPYLVMAATIAAGLDGIQSQMGNVPEKDPEAQDLPHSLDEALQALVEDEVLVEALGSTFIEWFVSSKRALEIDVLKASHDDPDDGCTQIEKEVELYASCI